MKARKITSQELEIAIHNVNHRYEGNIEFERFDTLNCGVNFTLRVKSSKEKGARRGFTRNKDGNRRRLAKACWHVHGHLFEEIFKIQPNATIRSGELKIDKDQGNWQDRNIGSMVDPLMFSEACDC